MKFENDWLNELVKQCDEYDKYNKAMTEVMKKEMRTKKFRPKIALKIKSENDIPVRYVVYSCPRCGKQLDGYKSATACDECYTLFDWSHKEAEVKVIYRAVWGDKEETNEAYKN